MNNNSLNSRTSSGLRVLDRTNLVSPLITNQLRANGENVAITGFASGDFQEISNKHGELLVNTVATDAPLECQVIDGTATIQLDIDEAEMALENNKLTTVPFVREFPLVYDSALRTESLV